MPNEFSITATPQMVRIGLMNGSYFIGTITQMPEFLAAFLTVNCVTIKCWEHSYNIHVTGWRDAEEFTFPLSSVAYVCPVER